MSEEKFVMQKIRLKPCKKLGCPEVTRNGYCWQHKEYEKAIKREYQKRKKPDKFYTSTRWRNARAMQLRSQPLCEDCLKQGRTRLAQMVHHETPIKQGGQLLNAKNFRSLCNGCHGRYKRKDSCS